MIITPKVRGFICTTAHPEGCKANVLAQICQIKSHSPLVTGPKKALIIGASTGYGLATRIAAAFGAKTATIGVFFERPAAGKRTATAGWYNSVAFEEAAHADGLYAKSINGDAFSHEIKQATVDLIKKDWGGEVDLVIYSLASPRRVHPTTGDIYQSTLKPIGDCVTAKTVDVLSGEVSEVSIEPANEDDINNTIAVMGGEDWQMWIDTLQKNDLLAEGVNTIAYSYIGPQLTHAIYLNGTIGAAKKDLQNTAKKLDEQLNPIGGHAYIAVNKAIVTQASAAIPIVPLYASILYKVMKTHGKHEGAIEQMWRLFSKKMEGDTVVTEEECLIRLDDLEMLPEVQAEVRAIWDEINTDNVYKLSDLNGYRHEFFKLFGFEVEGVEYEKEVEADLGMPSA